MRSMRERIALTELNAELNRVTAGVHSFAGRLKNTAEDVRDKHAAALKSLDGVLNFAPVCKLHVPSIQQLRGQGFMTRLRRPDYVTLRAGKLSTAAARKSAAEVSAEELQQSKTTSCSPKCTAKTWCHLGIYIPLGLSWLNICACRTVP